MVDPIDENSFHGLSLSQTKRALTQAFKAGGIAFPEDDAVELLMNAAGLSRTDIITRGAEVLPANISKQLFALALRRMNGEPVDHILGWREFYGRRFIVSKDVLSPRADTENLVRYALGAVAHIPAPRILDLGTGSGAILITLLAERIEARGFGVDVSQSALDIAQQNAAILGVNERADWLCGNWFEPLQGRESLRFDAILSNPPYITDTAMRGLEPEVKNYDPHLALSGGVDGLEAYRHIISCAHDWLTPQGWLGFEIGFDQAIPVSALMKAAGFGAVQTHKDLSGQARIVCASAKP